MLFPFRIDTLFKHYPYANWVIIALTVISFGLLAGDVYSWDVLEVMVLSGWNPVGWIGHVFLHGGFWHLFGNMLFLWVFGNAICANTSNAWYPVLYFGFGAAAAFTHVLLDGELAVGASGAVNGVVGMAVAMYPLNRVSVFWFAFLRFGTFQVPLWGLALFWLFWDVLGAFTGRGNVAYWAHLGGFFAGLGVGYLMLRKGWVELTEYDHRSLEEILTGKTAEARRERIERADAEFTRAEATHDPLVLTMTRATLARWRAAAEGLTVSEADAVLIQAGGEAGERRNLELLYGRSFVELGYSFHRSLADYYRRVSQERLWPHETLALAEFLRVVESDYEAMRRTGFVDEDVAFCRAEPRLAAFLRTK